MTVISHDVDLIVTCYERTYRQVLAPGFLLGIEEANKFRFRRKIVLVNNVNSRQEAEALAREGAAARELSEYQFVADRVDAAYQALGLRRSDFGRLPYYNEHFLVAMTLSGSPWFVHWDAEVTLAEPFDWINPCVSYLINHPAAFCANPDWGTGSLDRETLFRDGEFHIGYGFSDQLFLARRSDVNRPIYRYFSLPSWRYPLTHVSWTFESRIDAYMRRNQRYRVINPRARYIHPQGPSTTETVSLSPWEKIKRWRNKNAIRAIDRLPWKPERWVF